jgi:hypothetical protein
MVFHLAVFGGPWLFPSCGSAIFKSLTFCMQLMEKGNEHEVRCMEGFHWPNPEVAHVTVITETFSTQPCLLARELRRVIPRKAQMCT